MINLGDKVKDVICSFEGIAVARTEWLYGCDRIGVQAKKLHEGKPIDPEWFDVNQLEVVTEDEVVPEKQHDTRPGGPRKDPSSSRSGE